ncbi:MAG: glycoside hydrolase family 32 protein [Candidatus Latescibacteria bacterium]|nr:glycoside hydrolase family 32 protein [Candidatus Latescibacterota bacterium]
MTQTPIYRELHRPQFHFTPQKNWTNDPNGLVYYQGEYHLFFQHNPTSVKWGNMTWGHAVGTDLVHWEQLPNAIEPDELGTIFSGSAVVDWHNSAGFGQGDKPALVALYTSAGSLVEPPCPFTQSLAFSNDRGRTWNKYAGNPILGHIRADNRDPKVIWHQPSQRWVMALYLEGNDYTLYNSPDLKSWTHLGDWTLPGVTECPDFFPLAVDGDPADTRWVFWGADGGYLLGAFDGATFTQQTDVLNAEYGINGYAAQTWSDIPAEDGRRIQISWMRRGHYPSMPFNQQMSFPVELTLQTLPEGVRLCRQPIREIEHLHGRTHLWRDHPLTDGEPLVPDTQWDLFDIRATIELGDADQVGLEMRGHELAYDVADGIFTCLGEQVPIVPTEGRLELRMLVDRTSLETFIGAGQIAISSCFLPAAADVPLSFFARGGRAKLISLDIIELRSIWETQ